MQTISCFARFAFTGRAIWLDLARAHLTIRAPRKITARPRAVSRARLAVILHAAGA